MMRSGLADLNLHGGKAPDWLIGRMVRLAAALLEAIAEVHGPREALVRLSDPFFFQACSNVLGFDWDSSGSTTVTCGVLREALERIDIGVKAVGGKGKRSNILKDIDGLGEYLRLSTEEISEIKYGSRISAKVDTAAIQAGYNLYHHTVFACKDGGWIVIQQGMRPEEGLARRYHWLSYGLSDFILEPHRTIIGVRHSRVLDMTARESEGSRRVCVDLIHEGSARLRRLFESFKDPYQSRLARWMDWGTDPTFKRYSIPHRVNWEALERLYMNPPSNFEGLLTAAGVGPATIRGLAFLAELLFGEEASWRDPVKYSFAFGGKDGVPFPVDRKAMDEATILLERAVESAKIGEKDRLDALARLRRLQFNGKASHR
ncbi:MAG: DUF763 domain-containing protein [Candidatus Bathyarchaeia archaeon]